MTRAGTPALAYERIVAIGVTPSSSAFLRDMTTTAAAPSLMPEALPAVTEPSGSKAGRSLPSTSVVVSGRKCSSLSTITGPLRDFTSTGTISSAKAPRSQACDVFCWLW